MIAPEGLLSENGSHGFSRRAFVKALVGSSALSVVAFNRLNAAVYESLASLNKQYPQDPSPDGAYWDAVRQHYIFEDGLIMMNNGTVGPMPEPVFNTLVDAFKVQCTSPCDVYGVLPGRREEVRPKLAAFINASPDEVVLTRNTTEGMNFVANGLDLGPGDEVVMSSMEHPAGIHPWRLKAKRYGITVTDVPIGLPPQSVEEITDAFERAITPRTKVISISHTVYISGLIAPIKELSEIAHQRGIVLLADSAHGIGMLNLDMKELGADFFTSSPYKWLGAPVGCGLLYVSEEVQDRLWPTIASSGWDTDETARRFETLGQRADPIVIALGEAIDFQNLIGKERIERRIQTLASHLKTELDGIRGVHLHTSHDPYLSGGLTAFSVDGVQPERIVDYLREKYNIVIRTIGSEEAGTRGVRVSTHIFVSLEHVDMVLEGVKYLADHA
ncbi:MAG: aminotransferase class V-fold PLP-dependent enzyme [Gemmatimonadota bacterium]|nr:MAG: aminotransferase class V-fold PLP-dependent enzyme [Gemmatimonadota bacterium]